MQNPGIHKTIRQHFLYFSKRMLAVLFLVSLRKGKWMILSNYILSNGPILKIIQSIPQGGFTGRLGANASFWGSGGLSR